MCRNGVDFYRSSEVELELTSVQKPDIDVLLLIVNAMLSHAKMFPPHYGVVGMSVFQGLKVRNRSAVSNQIQISTFQWS